MTPALMVRGERVNVCEEGGNWHVDGSVYQGGLGWLHATWLEFRLPGMPLWADDATPRAQVRAMYRFIAHYHIAWPDQHGCTGGY